MARMEYDRETKQVKDVSPGRSVYLSNKQWAALHQYLDRREPDLFEQETTGALSKLLKISEEVVNK